LFLCELALESEWWRLRGLIFGLVWVYWMGWRFFGEDAEVGAVLGSWFSFLMCGGVELVVCIVGNRRDGEW